MSDSKKLCVASFALALLLPVAAHADAVMQANVAGGRLSPPAALGHHLYIGSGASVDVWDIAHYATPVRVDRVALGPVCGVTLVEDYLYACFTSAQFSSGLEVYSLADPAHPASATGFSGSNGYDHIVAHGSYVYMIGPSSGLTVYTANPPPGLFVVGGTDALLGPIQQVSLHDDLLLVGSWNPYGDALLTAFDLSNALHPPQTLVEWVTLGASSTKDHALTGNYLIDLLSGGIVVYDAHDLGGVIQVSSQPTAPATRMLVDRNVLYLFGGPTLQIFDLTTLPNPTALTPAPIDTTGAEEVLATDLGVLVLTDAGFATLIDDTNLTAPTVRSAFELPGSVDAPAGVSDGRHVFLADRNYGLKIDDAVSFAPIGRFAIGQDDYRGASEVALDGNVAFVLGREGLNAIDVSDPAHPEARGSLATLFNGHIAVEGAHAYLTIRNQASTFAIADIANPAAMQILGTLAVDTPRAVVVRGSLVFIASESFIDPAGLRVIDVTNAAAPAQVGTYTGCADTYGTAVDASADGRTVYLGCGDGSVHVLDVSNPAAPALVGRYQNGLYFPVTAIAVHGDSLYVGHARGFDDVDVSTPSTPMLRTSVPTADAVTSLAMSPDRSLYAFTGVAGTYRFVEPRNTRGHSAHARPAGGGGR
jgi:hypothetical protein